MILRELFVRLGLDLDAQSFTKGQLAADGIKFAVGKLVDFVARGAEKFLEMTKAVAESGNTISDTSQILGVTTDQLQRWSKVASETGTEQGALQGGMLALARNLRAAKEGGEEAAKSLRALGVSSESIRAGDIDAAMGEIATRMPTLKDGADKTALAMQTMGKSGAQLIPMFNEGREAIDEYRASATVMAQDQIAASSEIVKLQRKLAGVTTALWRDAIVSLLPAIRDLLKQFLEWRKANAEIMRQRLQQAVGLMINAVKLLGRVLSIVVNVLDFVTTNLGRLLKLLVESPIALGMLTAAIVFFKAEAIAAAASTAAAWLAAAAPFILIGGLIAGLLLIFDDFMTYQEGGDSLYGRWKAEIDSWLEPKENDVWFVKALKLAIGAIRDILSGGEKVRSMFSFLQYGDADFWRRGAAFEKGEGFTMSEEEIAAAKLRIGQADRARLAPGSGGNISVSVPDMPGMSVAPVPAGGGARTSIRTNIAQGAIVVNATPNQSAGEIADAVMSRVREERDSEYEAAHAALSSE